MNSFRKQLSPELEALSASPNLPRDHRSWPLGFRRMKQSLPQRLVSDGRNRTCPLGKNSSSRMLRALCLFAVNARQHFHREDPKDSKKTLSRSVWLRLGCSLLTCGIRGWFFLATDSHEFNSSWLLTQYASGNGGLPLDLSAPEVPYWPETSRSSIHFRWRVIFRKRQRDGSAEAGTPDSRTSSTRSSWWTQGSQIGQVSHGRDGHATRLSWHGRLARD